MVDLPLVPYSYQELDIQRMVANEGTGIVATQVGGGKTLIAIETAKRLELQTVFVIAPKGTHKRAWEKTIIRQVPYAQVKYINSTKAGQEAYAELLTGIAGWYLISPEFLERCRGLHSRR
jgi:DNA or RNA helicases of superfamily II